MIISTSLQGIIVDPSHKMKYMFTSQMQPPNAKPSKNWWKERAATRGLMVHGLCETPNDRPMITECDTIPSSRTWLTMEKISVLAILQDLHILASAAYYNVHHISYLCSSFPILLTGTT
jgi:hypothetical protein